MCAAFRQATEPFALTRHADGGVAIRVVGVGGAGGNAVARMIEDDIAGVEFIIANTDAQALSASPVTRRVRLGDALTRGLGAGGDPNTGARAAQESLEELRSLLRGSDLVFVTAGMGGGTGTGAAPIIARLARDLGALTVAVVSTPFRFEGTRRARIAQMGIDELRPHVDTLIVVPNERLLAIVDHHQPFAAALHTGDDILRQGVRGISDLITIPGLINLDFADVRSVIAEAGTALMAIGEASGDRRALEATQRAVESPLLERDIRGARRILLNVTGGPDLTLMEIHETATLVQSLAHPDAVIIFGTVQDEQLAGMMRVTLIATGFTNEAHPERRATGTTLVRQESSAVTRPLLPHPAYEYTYSTSGTPTRPVADPANSALVAADVITPEDLLGDAWPLPDAESTNEEPTIALPALPLRSTDDPEEPASQTTGRHQRSVETAWKAPTNGSDSGALDIPAFLRRP